METPPEKFSNVFASSFDFSSDISSVIGSIFWVATPTVEENTAVPQQWV